MCVCVCSETRRQFEIAFRMYDVDSSDYIDLEEFSRVCLSWGTLYIINNNILP